MGRCLTSGIGCRDVGGRAHSVKYKCLIGADVENIPDDIKTAKGTCAPLSITRWGHFGFCDSGGPPVAIGAVFHFEVSSAEAAETAFALKRPSVAAF